MFKVERWLRKLQQGLEKFYKEDLARLKEQCHYDPILVIRRNFMKVQIEVDRFFLPFI